MSQFSPNADSDPNVGSGGTTISWTPATIVELETAYQAAQEVGAESFTYDGNLYVVTYARYLIEHLVNTWTARGLWGPNGPIS